MSRFRFAFFFVVVIFGVLFSIGAKQVYAACNPAECGETGMLDCKDSWGPEYQCLAQCCVIPAGGGGGSPTPPPGPGYQYHSCPAGTARRVL